MRSLLAVVLAVFASLALADGRMFRNGHFPSGRVTVLELTEKQTELIDLYARCKDQNKSPFIFRLTKKQSDKLKREAGFSPKRFQVYDSFNGEKGAEYGYNYIVRFSKTEFEIPHEMLIPEVELRNWEVKVIGWEPSPLADIDPSRYKEGACPK